MAVGWTDDDAVLDQIQDTVNDEIHRARRNVPKEKACFIVRNAVKKFPRHGGKPCLACVSAWVVRKKPTSKIGLSACITAAAAKTAS